MFFLTGRRPLHITVAIILVLVMSLVGGPVLIPGPAMAADISSAYQILKNDPNNRAFLDRILAFGATESQVESFLNDLNGKVAEMGPLNDANFNRVMFEALQEVIQWRTHRAVLEALNDGFSEEIEYTLEHEKLHYKLLPLYKAVRQNLLGSPTSPGDQGGAGGGGGGIVNQPPSKVANLISSQIAEGNNPIKLSANSDTHEITIPGTSIQELNNQGKGMEIRFGNILMYLPPNSITVSGSDSISISVQKVSSSAGQEAISRLSTTLRLAGEIYEFSFGTQTDVLGVTFKKAVTVTLPYNPSLSSGDEQKLDVFYYDSLLKKWIAMKGTVDRSSKTITFQTTHFSKYAAMVSDSTPVTNQPPQPGTTPHFTDLKGHWAEAQVNKMVEMGLVAGISPTRFAPNRMITRAEFATLLVRALDLPTGTVVAGRFMDVPVNQWYFKPVNAAAQAGLVSGISKTHFAPQQAITREQMAVMVMRALEYKGEKVTAGEEKLAVFKDQGQISTWARNGVAGAVASGITSGRGQGLFAPQANATRAEAAVMILKMVDK